MQAWKKALEQDKAADHVLITGTKRKTVSGSVRVLWGGLLRWSHDRMWMWKRPRYGVDGRGEHWIRYVASVHEYGN